jgi:hypothetical protein
MIYPAMLGDFTFWSGVTVTRYTFLLAFGLLLIASLCQNIEQLIWLAGWEYASSCLMKVLVYKLEHAL